MNATSNEAVERDVMEYDFLIVGAGPAGLACAIRLKQLKSDLNICVLEKGAQPEWKESQAWQQEFQLD